MKFNYAAGEMYLRFQQLLLVVLLLALLLRGVVVLPLRGRQLTAQHLLPLQTPEEGVVKDLVVVLAAQSLLRLAFEQSLSKQSYRTDIRLFAYSLIPLGKRSLAYLMLRYSSGMSSE